MNRRIAAASLSTALALGVGIGRATVPSAPSPKFERICVEADGSAQVYANNDGRKVQMLVAPNHALPVQTRAGHKIADKVPPKLSAAIKAIVVEASSLVISGQ